MINSNVSKQIEDTKLMLKDIGFNFEDKPSPVKFNDLLDLHWEMLIYETGKNLQFLLNHPEELIGPRLLQIIKEVTLSEVYGSSFDIPLLESLLRSLSALILLLILRLLFPKFFILLQKNLLICVFEPFIVCFLALPSSRSFLKNSYLSIEFKSLFVKHVYGIAICFLVMEWTKIFI